MENHSQVLTACAALALAVFVIIAFDGTVLTATIIAGVRRTRIPVVALAVTNAIGRVCATAINASVCCAWIVIITIHIQRARRSWSACGRSFVAALVCAWGLARHTHTVLAVLVTVAKETIIAVHPTT